MYGEPVRSDVHLPSFEPTTDRCSASVAGFSASTSPAANKRQAPLPSADLSLGPDREVVILLFAGSAQRHLAIIGARAAEHCVTFPESSPYR